MAEYIARESAIEAIMSDPPDAHYQSWYAEKIKEIPAADVALVRHGRWDDEHKCTVCHNEAFCKISNILPDYDYDWEENLVETGGYIWDTEWLETTYCPNCGAKMDLEDSECDT